MGAFSREVVVDHTVHVQDVALLARVQARSGPSLRAHPLLDVPEILVVLFGDLAPAPLAPVLEELRLHAALVVIVGTEVQSWTGPELPARAGKTPVVGVSSELLVLDTDVVGPRQDLPV